MVESPLATRPNSSGAPTTAVPLPMTSLFVTVAGIVPKPGPQFAPIFRGCRGFPGEGPLKEISECVQTSECQW
jgi:hypothetical protein